MWEEAESESKEGKRTAVHESHGKHEQSAGMGVDEEWHVGFGIVTRLRVVETKEQRISKRDRFWGESYQQCSTAEIRSHSPVAGIFAIMWRCVGEVDLEKY